LSEHLIVHPAALSATGVAVTPAAVANDEVPGVQGVGSAVAPI